MKVGIDVSTLHSMNKGRGIGFYTDYLISSLKKYTDVEVVVIESGQWSRLRSATTGEAVVSDQKIDLIHYPFFDFFRPTLKINPDIPTVVTIHDVIPLLFPKNYPPGIKGRINLFRQKQALKKVKAIITDSETSTKDVQKLFNIKDNKVFSVYLDCADVFKEAKNKGELKSVLSKYKLPEKYFIYTGSVNWNKNLVTQTKAAIEAGVDVVFIGGGFEKRENLDHPEMRSYKEFLNKYASDPKVHIVGFVSSEELIVLLNGAQGLLYVSYYEGFGLPILEAQNCGTPVITGNISSTVEVAGGGAIMVDPSTDKDIIAAIHKLEDKSFSDSLIKKGFENSKRFSWEKASLETVKVYEYALSQS